MAGNGQDLWSSLEANHQGFEPVQEKSHATEDSVVKDENVPPFESCSSKTTMVQKHLVMQVCWLFSLSLSLSLSSSRIGNISDKSLLSSAAHGPTGRNSQPDQGTSRPIDEVSGRCRREVGNLRQSVCVSAVYTPRFTQNINSSS